MPALLGFVPENSLVLVALHDGQMAGVIRLDLSDALHRQMGYLAKVAANAQPSKVIAVFVDAGGAQCDTCDDEYHEAAEELRAELAEYGIELYATHVVDRVEAGGRWHCPDGCGANGLVEDPTSSPLTVAAVLEGRRIFRGRDELAAVTAVDDERMAAVSVAIDESLAARLDRADTAADWVQRDIAAARAAAERVAAGQQLDATEIAAVGCSLTDVMVRDTLYALAVGDDAGEAEMLWTELARTLPPLWRVEALVLLAYTAYSRGDGPLAGVSLESALRIDPTHRMASLLDMALQSAMGPEQIRRLAVTGYQLAQRFGVSLPPARPYRKRAG